MASRRSAGRRSLNNPRCSFARIRGVANRFVVRISRPAYTPRVFPPNNRRTFIVSLALAATLGSVLTAGALRAASGSKDTYEELETFATRLHLALPSVGERQMIVRRVAQEWSKANPGRAAVIELHHVAFSFFRRCFRRPDKVH